ncbi:MAG: sensor histidine kinase [Solirubrobacteraceae bacterium]
MTISAVKLPSALRGVRLLDLRIAALVAAIQIGGTVGASHHHAAGRRSCWWASGCNPPTHLDAAAIALLALAPVALVLRRVHPRAVLFVVFAVTLLYVALGYLQGPNYASLGVAFVTVVMAGDRTAAAITLVMSWALFLWLPDALGHAGAPTVLAALAIAAWLLVLLAGSEALRGKRDRALQTRRTREQESRRLANEERLRIARELHDVLAHSISLINIQSGVALHLIEEQPQQARIALAAINEASADALREVRSVLSVLRGTGEQPPRAPTAGLARLDELVSGATAAGVEVCLKVDGEQRPLPASVDLAAFRIVQESLTNIVRHASAAAATVQLTYRPGELMIQVDDDGVGSAAQAGRSTGTGNGIAGMHERASALGGELDAAPGATGGFRVRARLPLNGER